MPDKPLLIAAFLDNSGESELLEVWLFERNLEKDEAALEDDSHRVIENEIGAQVLRTQERLIPGFRVLLVAPDNPATVRIATQVAGIADIPPQNAEFHFRKVRQYVAGWEGLKVADLPLLFPGKKLNVEGAESDQEFAYCPENLDYLLRKSAPFYRWVNSQVNAREVQESVDLKN